MLPSSDYAVLEVGCLQLMSVLWFGLQHSSLGTSAIPEIILGLPPQFV